MPAVSKTSGAEESSRPPDFTPATQLVTLAHLARCPGHYHLVRGGKVRILDFSTTFHQLIFSAINEILDRSPTFSDPTPKVLVTKMLKEGYRDGDILREELIPLQKTVDSLYDIPLIPGFFCEEMILRLVRTQRMKQAIAKAAEKGDVDPVEFQQTVSRIVVESSYKSGNSQTGSLDQMTPERSLSMLPQAGMEKLPTGIPVLDRMLHGGLAPRKSGMICAYTGVGKSAFAVQAAWGSAQSGAPVLIFSTELGEDEFYRRLLSRAFGISYELIEHGGVGPDGRALERNRLNAAIDERKRRMMAEHVSLREAFSRINIVRMPDATIDEYRRVVSDEMERCKERFKMPLRLVIIDWLDKMTPVRLRGKNPELRHFLGAISQEVDDFGREMDIATWLTTQANDAASGMAKVTMKSLNESRSKAHPSSLFLGLGTTDEDKESGIWHVTCDKNRDGRTFSVRIRGDLDHQTFTDLSAEQMTAEQSRAAAPGVVLRQQRRARPSRT